MLRAIEAKVSTSNKRYAAAQGSPDAYQHGWLQAPHHMAGDAHSQEAKNKACDQIILIDASYSGLICDRKVDASQQPQGAGQQQSQQQRKP
jgi:hypothetical protein